MKNINHKEIFFNRAKIEDCEHICCDKCFEQLVFLLKDKHHEFSMSLTTVLQCLDFAIRSGNLPKLPESWVSDVADTLNYHFEEGVSYYDYETFEKRNKSDV